MPGILVGNSLASGVYMMVANRGEALRHAMSGSLPSYIGFSPAGRTPAAMLGSERRDARRDGERCLHQKDL